MKTNENPFLQGNYAPVLDELSVDNLPVTGTIPSDLMGIYMRNGPNPAFPPIHYVYPYDGDGMIHAIYLKNGKASYRNRFVETKGLLAERRAGRALYGSILQPVMPPPELLGPDADPGPFKNGAFIHIIRHANRYLALWETGSAYEITANLATLGEWCPDTQQPIPVNAHTRLDPRTGELFLITYDVMPPYLTYYQIDAQGKLKKTITIDKKYGTMLHDFALTEHYVIVFDCPAVFKVLDPTTMNISLEWEPALGTRIGVIPRDVGSNNISWIETDPFFVFHYANAYEKNNNIIVDFVWHEKLELEIADTTVLPPVLYRAMIDLDKKKFCKEKLSDYIVEFPRINDTINSYQHRFIYMPTHSQRNPTCLQTTEEDALLKYDTQLNIAQEHFFGEDAEISEAVFAPRFNAKSEEDGYLMLFVYHRNTNHSEFVILDAQRFSADPIAVIKLPRRVPHGLHGSWLPGNW